MRAMEGRHLLDQVQVGAGVEPLLTPHGQAALLQRAPSCWCTPGIEDPAPDLASSSLVGGMQGCATKDFRGLASEVEKMQGHAGNQQLLKRKHTKPFMDPLEKQGNVSISLNYKSIGFYSQMWNTMRVGISIVSLVPMRYGRGIVLCSVRRK